jgi:hypothetical protein
MTRRQPAACCTPCARAAQPSWRPTSLGGAADKLQPCPRNISRSVPKRCPVPFFAEGRKPEVGVAEGSAECMGGATADGEARSVRILQATTLANILVQWGFHEARGRMRASLPPGVFQRLDRPEGAAIALDLILRSRAPVIANILAAAPIGNCSAVEVQPEDIPFIRVMGPPSLLLQEHSFGLLAQETDSGRWARSLVSGPDVKGPCVAVARSPEEPLTILDGIHRAAVWAAHCSAGRDYALKINLIETQHPTWYEGQ